MNLPRDLDIKKLVYDGGAMQDRRVYFDDDVYQLEQERIFSRSWLFLTHENLIPKPGDFFTTFMGQDRVIVARDQQGKVHAFINSCPHRGNIICHADSGNRKTFICNYHGWVYGPDGNLLEVPLEKEVYPNGVDRNLWHPKQVRVESYGGFLFGNFDERAPSLRDYLGDMAWYLDCFMDVPGGSELLGPPIKVKIEANWKFFAENFIGDFYHAGWTHAAGLMVIGGPLTAILGNQVCGEGIQFGTAFGHGFNATHGSNALGSEIVPSVHQGEILRQHTEWVKKRIPVMQKKLGEKRAELYNAIWDGGIFPNCSFLRGIDTWKVWMPKGPREIEVWTWTLVEADMPEELKQGIRHTNEKTFGAAGLLEGDDGENMEGNTRSSEGWVTRQTRLNTEAGRGQERENPDYPGLTSEPPVNELAHRNFLNMWRDMIELDDWDEIIAKRQQRRANQP